MSFGRRAGRKLGLRRFSGLTPLPSTAVPSGLVPSPSAWPMSRPAVPHAPTDPAAVDAVLRARRTHKVLGDPDRPLPAAELPVADVEALLEAMGTAPFHRPAHAVHGAADALVPWRAYVLGGGACRALLEVLRRRDALVGKIPGLLAAADLLVLLTWLPDPPAENATAAGPFAATVENMEHVAAAGAAAQNLLVAATARGLRTYWSSGGVLRTPEMSEVLGIPPREVLLGALFVARPDHADVQVLTTRLGDRRGPVGAWARRVAADAIG